MNHLIISPNSPFISVGGIERHIQNLVNFCKNKSGKYYFFLPYSSRTTKEHIKIGDNVEIIFLKSLNLSYGARKGTNKKNVAHKIIQKKSHEFFTYLNSFLGEKAIDRVIAQNFHLGLPPAYSLMLNMACFSRDIPVFLRIHSFSTNDLQTSIINDLLWEKVICVSKSVAGDCFHKGLDIKRIHTRYLGVDLNEFNPDNTSPSLKKKLHLPKDTKIILSASRILQGYKDILQEKGILNLLNAYARMAKRYPNTRLLLAVAKPPKELKEHFEAALNKLQGYVQIHNIEDQVIIKTFTLEDMPHVYAGSDIFVLASENETLGQVYIEAMASGTPVIGTKRGGVPEIISDNYNGYLIQPNDASKLAKRIERLLNDEKMYNRFVKNGLSVVTQKFNAQKLLSNYLSFISK